MVRGVPGRDVPGRCTSCACGLMGVKARTPPCFGDTGEVRGGSTVPFPCSAPG